MTCRKLRRDLPRFVGSLMPGPTPTPGAPCGVNETPMFFFFFPTVTSHLQTHRGAPSSELMELYFLP